MRIRDRYKEKQCPICAIKHKKRGAFCSKNCSNRGRDDVYREKMRNRLLNTEKGQMMTWNRNFGDTVEPVPPQIQKERPNIAQNQFVAGGDLWTIVDD